MRHSSSTVLVTGATGYVAGWVIKQLLEQGHVVHATVRDLENKVAVAHLRAIAEQSPGTLCLFEANLLRKGSFDAAVAGCAVVMHTASPFLLDGYDDAMEALIRPAVEGTQNVLDAVNRCNDVRRVVLTSSVAAVVGDNADLADAGKKTLDDDDWNITSSATHNPYHFSKVSAEREAWRMHAAQRRWELVTINPAAVFGPSLTKYSRSGTIDSMLNLAQGKFWPAVPDMLYPLVDVREVAQAHLAAAFNPDVRGRYIVSATEVTLLEMAGALRMRWGGRHRLPFLVAPKALVWALGPLFGPVTRRFLSRNIGFPIRLDTSRSVRELGIRYRPYQETLNEHFAQLVADGLV